MSKVTHLHANDTLIPTHYGICGARIPPSQLTIRWQLYVQDQDLGLLERLQMPWPVCKECVTKVPLLELAETDLDGSEDVWYQGCRRCGRVICGPRHQVYCKNCR